MDIEFKFFIIFGQIKNVIVEQHNFLSKICNYLSKIATFCPFPPTSLTHDAADHTMSHGLGFRRNTTVKNCTVDCHGRRFLRQENPGNVVSCPTSIWKKCFLNRCHAVKMQPEAEKKLKLIKQTDQVVQQWEQLR